MEHTTDREALVAALKAPYNFLPTTTGHGGSMTGAWAYICGSAEVTADALLGNPDSGYWRTEFPLENCSVGVVLKLMRESETDAEGAQARFAAYAQTPGCETARRIADYSDWLLNNESRSVATAAAYLVDGPDNEQPEFMPEYVRERILRGVPFANRHVVNTARIDYID